jgi:hypothetical protein
MFYLLSINIYFRISYNDLLSLQFIGNLKKLIHFDASTNNIKWVAPEIGTCCCLTDLTLSCNEIAVSVLAIFPIAGSLHVALELYFGLSYNFFLPMNE